MKRILSAVLCAVLLLALQPALPQTVSAEGLSRFDIRVTEPVATYRPDFSLEFNTNATVYSNVTWQENSTGFSAKLGSNDEFRAGLAYKVEIWILLGDGNYFPVDGYGDLATAITVNGKAISSLKIRDRNDQNQITEVTITCEYDPLPGSQISSVLVKGVPTPVAGNMPIYSFTLGSSSYGFYHTAPVVWWDMTTGEEMESSDTFVEGHKYQVNIWLYANREGGFTFKTDGSGNPQVSATINSWAADKVTKAYEQDGREVIDIRYTFPACQAAHTCAPTLVQLQKPTCVMPGFKAYYECSCGKCYEDAAGKKLITDMDGYGVIPADGHKEDTWSYNGTHHYKKCTTCREVIPGTNAAHTPGPEATETAAQKCTVCEFVIVPAKNHTHKLTLLPDVKPTCVATGTVAHYTCSGCSTLFSDAEGKKPLPADVNVIIPALGHAASDDWSYDEERHWRTCSNCQEVLSETQMVHEAAEGKCTTCGYTIDQEIEPTGTEPAPVQPDTQEEKPSIAPWIIAVVVGVVCFGAGIGAAVLIIKKKKQ